NSSTTTSSPPPPPHYHHNRNTTTTPQPEKKKRKEGEEPVTEDTSRKREIKTARRSGRASDLFTGGSSTASFEEMGSENDLFSTYIDVEKLSDRGGVSNGSVHAENPDPHLHLLRRTLDMRNQTAGEQEEKEARRQYERGGRRRRERGGGGSASENGEEEEEESSDSRYEKSSRGE
ncbi:hypothetical protein PIB30_101337, partial [Stylosanthes scabra]|nr:hypothetical protein [Stylosanthes scabra]